MLLLRPMSTVDEAFQALKHEQMLRGDLVRAEALEEKPDGAPPAPRVLRKDETLRSGGGGGGETSWAGLSSEWPRGKGKGKVADEDTNARAQVVVLRILTNKKPTGGK